VKNGSHSKADVTGFELNLHIIVLLLVMSLTMHHNILWQFPCSRHNKRHAITEW